MFFNSHYLEPETSRNDSTNDSATPITLSITNYDQIFLATRTNYYKFNTAMINELVENLMFKDNSILSDEINMLYPNKLDFFHSDADSQSSLLFDRCIESTVDHDILVKILWQRIYCDKSAMKFISMRYASYRSRTDSETNNYKVNLIESYFK